VEVRTLAEDPGLNDEVRKFLNLTLWRDFIDRRFYRKLTLEDPNYDPKYALVALERGNVIAAAIGVRRIREPAAVVEAQREVAWVKALAAKPEDVGRLKELITTLEEEFKREGRRHVRISDYASWYLTPGVDLEYDHIHAMLLDLGYKKVSEAVNYEVDLSRLYVPSRVASLAEKLRRDGVEIVELREESEELGRWVEERFSPFWRIEAEMGLKAEDGGVLVAKMGSRIAGFSVYGALRPDFFGPIGVDPELRGRGIGTVLLFETLKRMRGEGVRIATIPWTTHLFFYTQLPGVVGIRHFITLAKTIE